MRRVLVPVVVALGAFLLVVGVLAMVWAPGAVKKTPIDVNTLTRLSGEAAKIDPATGALDPRPIYAMNVTQVDADASTGDTAVWAQWSCVAFGTSGDCIDPENPNSVLVSEDELVTASYAIFGTDRVSAEGVDAADLPAAASNAGAGTTQGIVNKFPFDTQKKDYTYWDSTLGRDVDLTYEGTEKVEGLQTYLFKDVTSKAPIDVAENTPGTYSSTKEIHVDPVTGAIINQTEHQERWLEDGTPVLDLRIGFTEEQQESNAEDARDNGARLTLITTTVPIVGLVGGVVLIGAGLLLGRRNRTSGASPNNQRELVGA